MWSIIAVVFGGIITFFITKYFIKFKIMIRLSNEIRAIFIDSLVQIENLNQNDDVGAGEIVINNLDNTDILIQKFFHNISKSKAENINRHYNEYKKPYKSDHNAIVILRGMREDRGEPNDKSFLYVNNKIPNAKKIAIKHLRILINDFKRV